MAEEVPKEIWERKKLGLELRQKYELYFVALAFTLAGLTVQTAESSPLLWRVVVEIVGWVSLLTSGLLGLSCVSRLWRREVGVAEYLESQYATADSKLRAAVENLESLIQKLGRLQIACFVLGIGLLMLSRAAKLLLS